MHLNWKHACNSSALNIQVRCSLTYKRRITLHGTAISPHALCGRTLSDTLRGGCEVWGSFAAMSMKNPVVWNVTSCSLV